MWYNRSGVTCLEHRSGLLSLNEGIRGIALEEMKSQSLPDDEAGDKHSGVLGKLVQR